MKPVATVPPALFRSTRGNTYAIAGSVWVKVPDTTTFDDLHKYITYKAPEYVRVPGEKTWSIKGSRGNLYTVKLSEGSYSCDCAGYAFRRKCRHIEEAKNESR